MYTEDDLLPLSALQHLIFCERQCALIHIEQVWAENCNATEVVFGCRFFQSITLPKAEQESHKRLKEKSSNVGHLSYSYKNS